MREIKDEIAFLDAHQMRVDVSKDSKFTQGEKVVLKNKSKEAFTLDADRSFKNSKSMQTKLI